MDKDYTMIQWVIPEYKFALRENLKDKKEFLPSRAENLASGWDVRCAADEELIISPNQYVKIPLGFRTFCPPGWWFELKPRSSTFGKKFLHSLYGTIDESFEGELLFAAQYVPETDNILYISVGEAIGQIIPVRRQEMIVTEVSNEEYDRLCRERGASRGSGGFGSTDRKK